jgi:molecular chaperone DnaJ
VLDPAAREAVEAYRAATARKPLRSRLFEEA